MLFNSLDYLVFLAVIVPVYFLLPHVLRAAWLTIVSYYFYMCARPEMGWLLGGCTIVAYLAGLAMERWPRTKRLTLILAIGANCGVLAYFKYWEFLKASLNHFGSHFRVESIALPVGISFFTFQALSYVMDVYRGRFPAEHRLDVFAAFKAFFPQLVAGPIERPGNVIPQLKLKHHWDFERVTSGARLMLWGFFKKLIIADRLAPFVQETYASPASATGGQLLLATYAFAFQIFCDFSAYTDIARGTARILGIDLMENFRAPYFARSVPEFWTRWHISLSTWFRDYLYIPLGGNRVPWWRWQFNIAVVFLVSGLWHGADWKFVVWGALHGAGILIVNLIVRLRSPLVRSNFWLWHALGTLATFHFVCAAWVFFRAKSLADAVLILKKIALHPFKAPLLTNSFPLDAALCTLAAVLVLEGVHALQARGGAVAFIERRPAWVRWPAYYALMAAIFFLTPKGTREFIYFAF